MSAGPDPRRWGRSLLGGGRLLLPRTSRRDAAAGLGLFSPNSTRARAGIRAYSLAVTALGPRLTTRSLAVLPHIFTTCGPEVLDALSDKVGPVTGVALIDPRQDDRPRLALLCLRDGVPLCFVKLNATAGQLAGELAALEALGHGTIVRTPEVLAQGTTRGVEWMVTSAMSSPHTSPVTALPVGWRSGAEFTALEPLLGPRPEAGWVALHGDLTPWNLRHSAGETWLLDWEDVRWGPPGADEAYFAATATVVCGAPLQHVERAPVDFWEPIIAARPASGREERFRSQLLATLRRMAGPPS